MLAEFYAPESLPRAAFANMQSFAAIFTKHLNFAGRTATYLLAWHAGRSEQSHKQMGRSAYL